jgi:nucleoside-diphosphate-sugar epimerase
VRETNDEYRDRRVLVTGATGFLGGALTARLADAGAIVTATSRSLRQSPNIHSATVSWRQADLSQPGTARRLLEETQPQVVFHLAGVISASPGIELVLPTLESHLLSAVHLLSATVAWPCRVVMAASLHEPDHEFEPAPASPYAASKWATGGYARMFHALYGCDCVLARQFVIYGPGQERTKLIPHTICKLAEGDAPKFSSGRWRADWMYVEDATSGFLVAGAAPGLGGKVFDFGTGELTSVREIVGMIAEMMESGVDPQFNILPDRPHEPVRVANIARTFATLGWRPQVSLREGLRRTIAWYQDELRRECGV